MRIDRCMTRQLQMSSPLSSCTDYLDRAKRAQDPTQGVLGAGPQFAIQAAAAGKPSMDPVTPGQMHSLGGDTAHRQCRGARKKCLSTGPQLVQRRAQQQAEQARCALVAPGLQP